MTNTTEFTGESRSLPKTGTLAAPRLLLCLTLTMVIAPATARAGDEVPGAPQTRPIALTNCHVHPLVGPGIKKGTVLFDNGRITAIGREVPLPKNTEVIDLKGQHVYPSLIESYSQIGLEEISAVRASRDYSETGSINPNVRANVSVNPDSELIPVTRANGVLIAVSAPTGGRVSGVSSVMQLDGWTYEDMTLKAAAAMVVNWPTPPSTGESSGLKVLRKLFDDARAYKAARNADTGTQQFDIRLDAMLPVIAGDLPLLVIAKKTRQIQAAVAFAVEQKIRLIIFGGHDAESCAALLKKHDVPVIIDSVHRKPVRRYEAYDVAYTLPARLSKAGVKFCISGSGRNETSNLRNLPYHAATAAAHGLRRDEALRSITLYPAQILGISDRVGSLGPGKDATLIVTTGDPLETDTHVTRAFVQGRSVQLTSRHTRLRDKYLEKYRQQK
ncbi:MAG TPA: imidazolonepropionase [Fuerstia sp.]|nr:imidazolonepropionase [Fuerstiella sp.]